MTCVYLGGTVENFKFRLPSADSNARWMSKIIYGIKLELLKNVFRMSEAEQQKVSEFAQFAAVVRYWLETPLTVAALRNDLSLYNLLLQFRLVKGSMAFEVSFSPFIFN